MKEINEIEKLFDNLPRARDITNCDDKIKKFNTDKFELTTMGDAQCLIDDILKELEKAYKDIFEFQGIISSIMELIPIIKEQVNTSVDYWQNEITIRNTDNKIKEDQLNELQVRYDSFKEAIALMSGVKLDKPEKVEDIKIESKEKDEEKAYIVYINKEPYEGPQYGRWIRTKTFYNYKNAEKYVNSILDVYDGKGNSWGGEIEIRDDSGNVILHKKWDRF